MRDLLSECTTPIGRPRFLVDVTKVCTETIVLGVQLKVPILASSASPGWPQGLLHSLHSHGVRRAWAADMFEVPHNLTVNHPAYTGARCRRSIIKDRRWCCCVRCQRSSSSAMQWLPAGHCAHSARRVQLQSHVDRHRGGCARCWRYCSHAVTASRARHHLVARRTTYQGRARCWNKGSCGWRGGAS